MASDVGLIINVKNVGNIHNMKHARSVLSSGLANFQPLEVLSRYRDPQLQVAENCL